MKKRKISHPRLHGEKARLEVQIADMRKQLAELEAEHSMRWELRGMHGDIDSIKHMVRSLYDHFKVELLDTVVNVKQSAIDRIIQEVRGSYMNPQQPPSNPRSKK